MSSLYSLLTFLILFSVTKGQINLSGFRFKTFSNASSCDQTTEVSYICVNRTAFQTCYNGLTLGQPTPCPTHVPNCDRGECVAQSPAVSFTCPDKDGYYPDPGNCTIYHICVRGKATTEQCLTNTVYNPTTYSCVRRTTAPCHRIDCSGKDFGVAAYPGDKSIFGVCSNKQVVAVGKCEDNLEMDPADSRCKMVCKKEGNFHDSTSFYHYYECYISTNVYASRKKQCPKNTFFNRVRGQCMTGDPNIDCFRCF